MQGSDPVLQVSEFIELINQTLEFAYPQVGIEGEISNFKIAQNKWVHFDLKDAEATINCFMTVYQLQTELEDGMKVRVSASPKLTKWGRFSVTVKSVELVGEGALQRAFEILKGKLSKEGLFDPARKRSIPTIPATIGVVSSSGAAGYKDFIEIVAQRWGGLNIQLANVQVQGAPAPLQIAHAIEYFNQQTPLVDVLVIIRGGGSLEDLQAFNTERVVRAIAASRIPTVVGVGHEVDVTLADMVADERAATPTDAARRVVPDRREVLTGLEHSQARMVGGISSMLQRQRLSLNQGLNRLEQFIQVPKQKILQLSGQLLQNIEVMQERNNSQLVSYVRVLMNVDPRRILARGYAIARKNGQVIRSKADVKIGDSLVIQLAKDSINSEVIDAG